MIKALSTIAVGALSMTLSMGAMADAQADLIKEGQKVYHTKSLGNCVTCHAIQDPIANQAGNQGPMIIAMKARFPVKSELRQQVWDATLKNPKSLMPPMGKHRILTEEQIDAVVEYIYQY